MVSCGQNRPEQNDTEQNTSEVTEEMTPNTITTTAVSNKETEPVDLSEDFSLENLKGKTDPEVIRQELSVLPLNIDELKDYPVYVLDHIHMYVAIPPKISVSEFMSYLKGKSTLMLFDRHPEYRQKWGDRHFWARGYYVSTVGNVNEDTIRKYIQEQEENDKLEDGRR